MGALSDALLPAYILLGIKICLNNNSCFILEEKNLQVKLLSSILLSNLNGDFLFLKIAVYKCLIKCLQLSLHENMDAIRGLGGKFV